FRRRRQSGPALLRSGTLRWRKSKSRDRAPGTVPAPTTIGVVRCQVAFQFMHALRAAATGAAAKTRGRRDRKFVPTLSRVRVRANDASDPERSGSSIHERPQDRRRRLSPRTRPRPRPPGGHRGLVASRRGASNNPPPGSAFLTETQRRVDTRRHPPRPPAAARGLRNRVQTAAQAGSIALTSWPDRLRSRGGSPPGAEYGGGILYGSSGWRRKATGPIGHGLPEVARELRRL